MPVDFPGDGLGLLWSEPLKVTVEGPLRTSCFATKHEIKHCDIVNMCYCNIL